MAPAVRAVYFNFFIIIKIWFLDIAVNAYKQTFFTPAEENYYLMEDYGHSVLGKNTFLFEVQACNNVHILLMKDRDDFEENVYEIVIGNFKTSFYIFSLISLCIYLWFSI